MQYWFVITGQSELHLKTKAMWIYESQLTPIEAFKCLLWCLTGYVCISYCSCPVRLLTTPKILCFLTACVELQTHVFWRSYRENWEKSLTLFPSKVKIWNKKEPPWSVFLPSQHLWSMFMVQKLFINYWN